MISNVAHIHSRLDIFDPTILRNETLAITVILLLKWNRFVLFYKEQGFMIGVKKVSMIYGFTDFYSKKTVANLYSQSKFSFR